jgi:SulP family sulfate permease
MDVPAGFQLFAQCDPANAMYFVDTGSVTAELALGEGRSARLRTVLSGTVVGEVGMCLRGPRSGTVVAAEPTTLYRLTDAALQRMEAGEPDLAAALYRWIAQMMADRLSENNSMLVALLD